MRSGWTFKQTGFTFGHKGDPPVAPIGGCPQGAEPYFCEPNPATSVRRSRCALRTWRPITGSNACACAALRRTRRVPPRRHSAEPQDARAPNARAATETQACVGCASPLGVGVVAFASTPLPPCGRDHSRPHRAARGLKQSLFRQHRSLAEIARWSRRVRSRRQTQSSCPSPSPFPAAKGAVRVHLDL